MAERRADTARHGETATRALAIVLMREVMPLLETLGETVAAGHLQMAIDTVTGHSGALRTKGSC